MAAAELAGKLMAKYAVNVSEVEIHDGKCVEFAIDIGGVTPPINTVLPALTIFCGCKVYVKGQRNFVNKRTRKYMQYVFFGFPDDVKMAIYLYKTIDLAMETEHVLFKLSAAYRNAVSAKSATTCFYHGMARRLYDRLMDLHRVNVRAIDAVRRTSAGTSIVTLKHQVVQKQFDDLNLTAGNPVKRTLRDGNAFRAGQEAADRVNLQRSLVG
jgi:hypothetical protein